MHNNDIKYVCYVCPDQPYSNLLILLLDLIIIPTKMFVTIHVTICVQLCNKQMEKQRVWGVPLSKNFDFTSSKVIVMDVTKLTESNGWDVATKFQSVSQTS